MSDTVSEKKSILTTRDVADYLGVSERTLLRWRANEEGPTWTYVGGRVRYLLEDLNSYVERNRYRPGE